MSVTLLFVASVTLQPATATASLAQNQAAETTKADDPNRVICRRERVIGSRVASRKICMTARDRNRASDVTQQEMGELIKRNTGGATPQ